jgi:hypothetical protein
MTVSHASFSVEGDKMTDSNPHKAFSRMGSGQECAFNCDQGLC